MLEVMGERIISGRLRPRAEQQGRYRKHALKNALIPIITVIGTYTGRLLGGTVLVETVFTRPGMGKLLVDAMMARDYPVVQGTIILFALV